MKNLLEREMYLSDAPLNYYRYLLLEMDEDLCAEDSARVRSWIFPIMNGLLPELLIGLEGKVTRYGIDFAFSCSFHRAQNHCAEPCVSL